MGFYKNAAYDMRARGIPVSMSNVSRLTVRRATVIEPPPRPSMRISTMSNRNDKHDEGRTQHREAKGSAKGDPSIVHAPAQNPDQQPSSRGGGGLAPSDEPVLLLHRRGRADSNMLTDFKDEAAARKYAGEHKLMIVHSEKVGGQLKLYYLPE